ncbi:MAG: hypothetical protein M3Z33_04120 [Actinomycetota bacterium]|nr:hypothetical protein [Actinomycetota bacterium]
MPTNHPRIQVTVDPELAAALDEVEAHVLSRGRAGLLRELALRGARDALGEAQARGEALEYLLAYDFGELRGIHEERHARLP